MAKVHTECADAMPAISHRYIANVFVYGRGFIFSTLYLLPNTFTPKCPSVRTWTKEVRGHASFLGTVSFPYRSGARGALNKATYLPALCPATVPPSAAEIEGAGQAAKSAGSASTPFQSTMGNDFACGYRI